MHSLRSSSSLLPYREYSALMPTPACFATAVIGAPGSAMNTARAESRMSWSLRAAWARRPLSRPGTVSVMPWILSEQTLPFQSALRYDGTEDFVPIK